MMNVIWLRIGCGTWLGLMIALFIVKLPDLAYAMGVVLVCISVAFVTLVAIALLLASFDPRD